MRIVAQLLLGFLLPVAGFAGEPAVQGVVITANGVVLAAGSGSVGQETALRQAGMDYPARILAAADGMILLKADATFIPVMLADDKTLAETRNFCALAGLGGDVRCHKLRPGGKARGDSARLQLHAGEAEQIRVGTPVFSRRGKLVGVVVARSGSVAEVAHARSIRRLMALVPDIAGSLVPTRSTEVIDARRLAQTAALHLVQVINEGLPVTASGSESAPREKSPPKTEAPVVGNGKSKRGKRGATETPLPEKTQAPAPSIADIERLHAEASGHFHAGRHVDAYKAYRSAAEQGYARSQVSLGLLYEEGLGTARDYEEAAAWYRKAADAGELLGYMNLGRLFELGRGVPEDPFHAAVLYSKAAERGHKPAHQALDRLFHKNR